MARNLSAWMRWAMVVAALGVFVGSTTLFSLLDQRDTKVGAALILATAASGVLLHSVVRHQFMTDSVVLAKRVVVFGVVIAAGAGLVLLWRRPGAPDGWGFWGGVLIFIGLGLAIAELRRSKRASSWVGGLSAVSAAALLVAAWIRMSDGLTPAVAGMFVVAVALLPVSLSLLSAVCNRRLKSWPARRAFKLLGAAFVAFGVSLALARSAFNLGWDFVLPVGLLVLLLMVGTASRSNGDVAIVIIGIAFFFAATPTPAPGPPPPTGNRPVMVALGDSFMSGEGADDFFENTNVHERNTCRRAPTAYAYRLVTEEDPPPLDLVFMACSGAKAREVYEPSDRTEASDGKGLNQIGLAQDALTHAGVGMDDVSFAILSIGGNDSFFGVIARACLAPGDCTELGNSWRANLRNLPAELRKTYRAVQSGLPQVPVLVVPYPIPIAREKGECSYTTFTRTEHRFLHDFARELNSTIAAVVSEPEFDHLHYVDPVRRTLLDANLALCDGRPDRMGVNFLAANGVEGLVESSVNPTNWIHNSMHPNRRGHARLHTTVRRWLDEHPDVRKGSAGAKRAAPPMVPDDGAFGPIDPSARCVDVVLGSPPADVTEALEDCTDEWTLAEIRSFAAFPGVVLLLPLLAAWVIALATVRLARIAGQWAWRHPRVASARQRFGLQ